MEIPLGQKVSPVEKPAEQPNQPAGWWKLNLSGVCEAVENKVRGTEGIPRRWQAAIIEDIKSLDAKYNFVEVHAQYTVHDGMGNLHYSLTPSTALV